MNAMGITLTWCAIQVTLVGLLAAGLYAVARRIRPSTGSLVVSASLAIIAVLSAMAFSPWPQWPFTKALPQSESGSMQGEARSTPVPEGNAEGLLPPDRPEHAQATDQPAPPETAEPAALALFWQALLEELSHRPARPERAAWRWPALVGVGLTVAAGVGLVWLLAGVLAVRGYRRRSRPVEDARLLELVDVLRAELDCHRRIEVRRSEELVTAAAVGWLRPLVFLPADWTGWNDAQRRAVLAHEIAHIRSHDLLASLLGLVGLVLHFYHPLVHWLMGRLRLEQELAADAAAAAVSGGQREYLTAIAELALRQHDRPVVWPARTFLPTRTTFLRRIAMLRDSQLPSGRLSPAARVLTVASVAVLGLLAAGLRGPSGPVAALADAAGQRTGRRTTAPQGAIDLAYVPTEAHAITVIRPAAFLDKLGLEEEQILGQGMVPLTSSHRLALGKTDQVTYVLLERPQPREDLPEPGMTIIIRTVTAEDLEALMEPSVADSTAKEFLGRTYYVRPGDRRIADAYFKADERTMILSTSERGLLKFMQASTDGPPRLLSGLRWRQFENDHAFAVVDTTFFTAFEGWPGAPFAPFAPLWKETSQVAIGIDLDGQARLYAVASCREEDGARKVKETLEATKVLARNANQQLKAQMGKAGPWDEALIRAVVDLNEQLLAGARVDQRGKMVRVETFAEVDRSRLGPVALAVASARSAAQRTQSMNHLKQVGLAMHVYHSRHKSLPPAVLYGPDGKTPHSWRVAILPYLEQQRLYDRYRLDEPWDSPHNRQLLEQIPPVYRSSKDPPGSTNASVFVLTGPVTVFDDKEGTRFAEIRDGTSNTLMTVETKRDVPWTKPEDIAYDAEKPIPELGGCYEGGFNACLCDGSVRFVAETIEETVLRALLTKKGGEPIDRNTF